LLPPTAELKRSVALSNDIFQKLEMLHGVYAGQTGYIVCCGPSLAGYKVQELKAFLCDKLVLSVKQAFSLLSGETDFHILHHSNAQRYDYSGSHAIVLDENEGCGFSQPDLLLPKLPSDLYASISLLRNFDDFLLERTPVRPCGPGILYEIGLYLAVHLGLRRLVIVGWDLYSSPEQLRQLLSEGRIGQTHHYEQDWRTYAGWHEEASGEMGARLRRFREGGIINTLQYVPSDDIVLTACGTQAACGWASSHGLQLFRTAPSVNVTARIPVVDLYRTESTRYLDERAAATSGAHRDSEDFPHFAPLRSRQVTVLANDPRVAPGWHGCEHDGHQFFRWSGPGASSYVALPLDRSAPLEMTVYAKKFPGFDPRISIFADEIEIPYVVELPGSGEIVLRATLPPRPQTNADVFTRIQFRVSELFRPCERLPNSEDGRRLGFVFFKADFRPSAACLPATGLSDLVPSEVTCIS
jgi:hypothetical protein